MEGHLQTTASGSPNKSLLKDMRTLQNKLLRTVSNETFFSHRDSYYYEVNELLMLKSSHLSSQGDILAPRNSMFQKS